MRDEGLITPLLVLGDFNHEFLDLQLFDDHFIMFGECDSPNINTQLVRIMLVLVKSLAVDRWTSSKCKSRVRRG